MSITVAPYRCDCDLFVLCIFVNLFEKIFKLSDSLIEKTNTPMLESLVKVKEHRNGSRIEMP